MKVSPGGSLAEHKGAKMMACTQAWRLMPKVFASPPSENIESSKIFLTAIMGLVSLPPMIVPTTQATFIF